MRWSSRTEQRSESCGRRTPGSLGDLLVGEAHERDAGERERRRRGARSSLRRLGARCQRYESASTTSGDVRPVEIAHPARDDHVRRRARQSRARRTARRTAPRGGSARRPIPARTGRAPPSMPPFRAAGASVQRSRGRRSRGARCSAWSTTCLELDAAQAGGREVEHRARRRGDRQAVERRDVRGGQRTAAMKADARASRRRPLRPTLTSMIAGLRRGGLPGMRGAERGSGRRRHRRRAPPPTSAAGGAEDAVADGVDAAEERHGGGRTATRRSIWRCVSPAATSWRRADDAALARGDRGDDAIRVDLTTHTVV